MTRPKDKHTERTRTINNPKGTTSRTRSGTSQREHADPRGNIERIPLSNEKLLDTLAPRNGDKSPLIKHILRSHPLARAPTTTPAISAPTDLRQPIGHALAYNTAATTKYGGHSTAAFSTRRPSQPSNNCLHLR